VSATPAAAPSVTPTATVDDVRLEVPGQDHEVRAWLVRGGDDGTGRPAVLWLHWLGYRHNDRAEFLALAVQLASRGVVSLLPAGHFPWVPDPDGTADDVQRIHDQVAAHTVALDHLVSQPGVDPARVAELAGRLGDRMLLQWAGKDTFVSEDVRAAYAAANGDARSIVYEGADHMLDDRAAVDLVAFLAETLGLDQN
jgi:dienelactone hydrolase